MKAFSNFSSSWRMGGNSNSESIVKTCGKKFTTEYKNSHFLPQKLNALPSDTSKAINSLKKSLKAGNCSTISNNSKEWELHWCLTLKTPSPNIRQILKYLTTKMEKVALPTLNSWSYHLGCHMTHFSVVRSSVLGRECQFSHMPMNTKKESLVVFSGQASANRGYKTTDRLMTS